MKFLNSLRRFKQYLFGIDVHKAKRNPIKYETVFSKKKMKKQALMTVLVDPFLDSFDPEQERIHANRWYSPIIAKMFEEYGYAVDVTDWRNPNPPQGEYDLIFGLGQAYVQAARQANSQTKKIYFGTGAHASETSRAEFEQIKLLKKRRKKKCQARPLPEDLGSDFSDAIFFLGSDWVRSTYQSRSDVPCFSIRNPIVPVPKKIFDSSSRNYQTANKNFMWMAGYGAIRRRLDLVLEAFSQTPDLQLWVCGGIEHEKDFFAAYQKELQNTSQIHYVGWVDLGSQTFQDILDRCGYLIYPSTSDGAPGSVINTMVQGIVPLVTEATGIDTGGFGELITDCSVEGLIELIKQKSQVPAHELEQESKAVAQFAREKYTKEAFIRTFKEALQAVLGNPIS